MLELTKPQKLIYDMEKFAGGSIATVCGSIVIKGEKDVAELSNATNELYRINDALRIKIIETDGVPYQTITEYKEQEINVLHFKDKAELNYYAEKYAKEPMDFYGSLCYAQIVILENYYGILIKMHHIISDAWTLSLLGTQLCKLLNGESIEAYSYVDYIQTEKKYLMGKRFSKDSEYFESQFRKCNEVTLLNEKQVKTLITNRKTFIIENEITRLLIEYSKSNNSSVFSLMMTALASYISRIKMNVEKFYIGTPILNRATLSEQNTVGMFINTVPLLVEIENEKSFSENLQAIADESIALIRHQRFNYGEILNLIRSKYHFEEKLYDVILSYQNAQIDNNGEEVESTWYHPGMQAESLQIHIDDRDNEGILKIHYDYQTEKFTEKEICRMHEHIMNLLFDVINEDKRVANLNILSEDEKNTLLCEFNDTNIEYDKNKCVHRLFEEQAQRTPDKTALIFDDVKYTFEQLDRMSNSLAYYLRENGVKPNDIVPIISKRSWHIFVAILAINKAGGAFMSIDPNYPQDRIEYMLKDVNAEILLYFDCASDFKIKSIDLNTFNFYYNVNKIENINTSEDLTYLIFTSGSTGLPKGLKIKHSNAVNFCNRNSLNVCNKILKDDYEIFLSVTNTTFDMFITECFIPLTCGYTILFANDIQVTNPAALAKMCNKYSPDIMETTPTKLKAYISNCNDLSYIKKLKAIILGGEALPDAFLEELKRLTSATIFNNYGPAETTVWSTIEKTSDDEITIGKPIANTQIYIVDKYNNLMPTGQIGELCIAGDGVGAGYLNRPELTEEKFVENPFGDGKMYKTGDLAFWRDDGSLIYAGRNDFQVKIRGLRIELGEIESAIDSVEGVSQAVVVVRKGTNGRQLICAFYTEQTKVDISDIKSAISSKLPRYMMPHIFTVLSEMPLTTSGKINRKALPKIDLTNINTDVKYVKPQTELQKELAKLMEMVLNYLPVGLNDDFFDLGGDSLKAIEFVSKAHSEGIYFGLQDIFDNPTIGQLCKKIEKNDRQSVSFSDTDFSKINEILSNNTLDKINVPEKTEPGNILLAGATGFLGMHILSNFLDGDTGIAYCAVRGIDTKSSKKRFFELLHFYFEKKYDDSDRIVVICADLNKEKFGLTDDEYSALVSNVDTVINTAASVKHYGSYGYFYEANVETVNQLIEFCKKSDAKLIHTSTLSVSGNSFADDFKGKVSDSELDFAESNLYISQPLDNVYVRTKFEAEKRILEEMSCGLKANIMRMGNLTNRFSDAKFQRNYESNSFLNRLKAILDLGMIPEYLMNLYLEFTPVDDAANAVMTIARHFSTEHTVFHINSDKVLYMDKVVEYFKKCGINIKVADSFTFADTLKSTVKQIRTEYIFETFINDMDEDGNLNYDTKIRVENEFTVEYLRNLGFKWSNIDFDYIKGYIDYFKNIGYLEV